MPVIRSLQHIMTANALRSVHCIFTTALVGTTGCGPHMAIHLLFYFSHIMVSVNDTFSYTLYDEQLLSGALSYLSMPIQGAVVKIASLLQPDTTNKSADVTKTFQNSSEVFTFLCQKWPLISELSKCLCQNRQENKSPQHPFQ